MLRLAVVAPPMAHQAHSSSRSPALRVRAAPPKRHIPARASAGDAPTQPSMQLATAKVPGGVDVPAFNEYLWQWASTLTQNGANLPFALVLKADKLPSGCQIGLLKRDSASGKFASAGDIRMTVEPVPNEGDILFIRLFEGPMGMADRRSPPPADPQQRLEVLLGSLKDVDTIMGAAPAAIIKGFKQFGAK